MTYTIRIYTYRYKDFPLETVRVEAASMLEAKRLALNLTAAKKADSYSIVDSVGACLW